MMNVIFAVLVLGVIAVVFGLILSVAAKAFEVKVDERLPKIQACLAGANCGGCGYPGCAGCADPKAELAALMKYMVGHNAAHAKELADLAVQLDKAGDHTAYEQVMAAVSDFEKGNMRLSVVLSSLEVK